MEFHLAIVVILFATSLGLGEDVLENDVSASGKIFLTLPRVFTKRN